MSSTEDKLASVFFVEWLLPMRHMNVRRGVTYLDRGPRRPTYWSPVVSRTGGLERVAPRCDAAFMLDQLGRYWKRQNEPQLLQLVPPLQQLQQQLSGGARADDSTDPPPLKEFVYPMF